MEYSKNYPVKSGEIVGDYIIFLVFSLISGAMIYEYMKNGNLTILTIGIVLIVLTAVNFYTGIYHLMKSYEDNYGPSKVGDKWK